MPRDEPPAFGAEPIAQFEREREFRRIWDRSKPTTDSPTSEGVSLDDFYAYMPMHSYLYVPSREMWPATSINARIPPVALPVLDEQGKPKTIKPSLWLDQNRPVEQMTWTPGEPLLIADRLVSHGGWIEQQGVHCLNLYRPPTIRRGNAALAGPWLDHVHKVYPDDAEHIVAWLAQRVQRPQDKINHALVLGGKWGSAKTRSSSRSSELLGRGTFLRSSRNNCSVASMGLSNL